MLSKGEAALPNAPETLSIILPAYLFVARPDFAGLVIDRLIARAPDVLRELPPEWVYATLRDSGEASETIENRRIGLAELGFGGHEGDYMTSAAIGILMRRGEVERAKSLLRYVDAPRAVENLLIQRRFASLWPALTEQAGPKLANSRQSMVRHALQTYSEKPDDNGALADLISAYRYARRYSDAIELRNKLPTSAADFAAADEQMGWAINNLALALHSAGQAEEADRLYASLNEALPANGWRVNMFINRAELLVQDGKFKAANTADRHSREGAEVALCRAASAAAAILRAISPGSQARGRCPPADGDRARERCSRTHHRRARLHRRTG